MLFRMLKFCNDLFFAVVRIAWTSPRRPWVLSTGLLQVLHLTWYISCPCYWQCWIFGLQSAGLLNTGFTPLEAVGCITGTATAVFLMVTAYNRFTTVGKCIGTASIGWASVSPPDLWCLLWSNRMHAFLIVAVFSKLKLQLILILTQEH